MSKFRTKARAVDLLGEQAIKDEATAVFELFKNAHDADADEAEIQVNTKTNSLVLWDDGCGMSREDVETKWLTLGTDSKHTGPEPVARTTPKGRPVMGEKGVGRLAVAMLGHQLLLITKKPDTTYTVGYIHWDLFSNSSVFLEDTVIPVKPAASLQELRGLVPQLRDEQRRNLVGEAGEFLPAWAGDYHVKATKILSEIDGFTVDWPLVETYFPEIETSGTLFYIRGLKENWSALAAAVDKDSKGARLGRKLESLQKAMSSFTNTIALFERQQTEEHKSKPKRLHDQDTAKRGEREEPPPFKVTLAVNGQEIASQEVFEQGDLDKYDYGLTGDIVNGVFTGKAWIQGHLLPDPVTFDARDGIDVLENTDCGPVKLRLYFVEGLHKHSLLSKTAWKTITGKLAGIGGIYVYRDGLRVLPYGTADFDFLEIEKKRTLSLSRNMFSLRRMFGYVAITKGGNPLLQDKSSREGLRENPQFYYFRQVLMNLLNWWGQTYLQKEGRLKEHRETARGEHELAAVEGAAKKRAAARLVYVAKLMKAVDHAKQDMAKAAEEIRSRIISQLPPARRLQSQISLWRKESPQTYFRLLSASQLIDERKRSLEEEIEQLRAVATLPYDSRFADGRMATQYRDDYQTFLTRLTEELQDELESAWRSGHDYVKEQLSVCLDALSGYLTPGLTAQSFLSELDQAVANTEALVNSAKIQSQKALDDAITEKVMNYSNKIGELTAAVSQKQKAVADAWRVKLDPVFDPTAAKVESIQQDLVRLTGTETTDEFHATLRAIDDGITLIGRDLSLARQRADKIVQQALAEFSVPAADVLDYAAHAAEDRRLVGLLERQVEVLGAEVELYRTVAATGIAAEIVDHEFNQNYRRIRDILKGTAFTAVTKQYPELGQLQKLFILLETRHRMLSPLYRSSHLTKDRISLRNLADDIKENFFLTTFALNHIRFHNRIPETVGVKESAAILYPLFINLFHNAVYWMMSRQQRVIEVRIEGSSLYIEDSGTGIDPERAERVFDLFYTTRDEGRGIGLHLVRELLTARGHRIVCVTNRRERDLDGACFRVDFAPDTLEETAP